MTKTKTPRTTRLLNALQSGQAFTPSQITNRFKLANPSASINDIRRMGFAVAVSTTTKRNGDVVRKYVLAA